MGHDDRAAAPRGGVGPHPGHGGSQHPGVGALGGAEVVGDQSRLEVGERVDRDVADHHRAADVGDGGAQVDPGALEQARGEAEPRGRVVVAAGDDDPGAGVDQALEGLGQQLHGVGGGQRTVVDVAADQHGVDRLGAHDLDQVVEVGGLGPEQPDTVERAPQVPVGGVQQPHGAHARRPVRQTR